MIIVAIDIEKAGPLISDKIVSIGYVIKKEETMVYESCPPFIERTSVPLNEKMANVRVEWPTESGLGDFEAKTWNEFWTKQPNLEQYKVDAKELKDVLGMLVNDLNTYRKGGELMILSDNPSFDIACIDHFLHVELGMPPLRYLYGGYGDVINPMDMMFAHKKMWESESACRKMTHNPMENAEVIMNVYERVRSL